jgi:hypothetical protein
MDIDAQVYDHMPENYDFNAAIVHPNRVCDIVLSYLTNTQMQRLASAMQEQFPALRYLRLKVPSSGHAAPVPALSDGFFGGSAPRLQSLNLDSVPFPALPKLLLSATDLDHLVLQNIPHSGYFSPEAILAAMAVLANLRNLHIEFESPLSRPDRES